MESIPQQNALRRAGIALITLALLIYLIAVFQYFTGHVDKLTMYLLIGAHVVLLIGLLLFMVALRPNGSALTKLVLIFLFIFLLAIPIYFYTLIGSYANFNSSLNTTVFYNKGKLNQITLQVPGNETPQAAPGIKRKISSYQLMATVNSNAHIIVSFDEGQPEIITVNNMAELASYEAVLRQPNVVMYVEGVTKTFKPDNLILKTF